MDRRSFSFTSLLFSNEQILIIYIGLLNGDP
jgi:hypothetical protein